MKGSNNKLSDESIRLLDNNEQRMNLIVTLILAIVDALMIIQVFLSPHKAYIIEPPDDSGGFIAEVRTWCIYTSGGVYIFCRY
jgi:hypothetical protein